MKRGIFAAARDVPWKVLNEVERFLAYPRARILFAFYGVEWRSGFRFYGVPIIQKFWGSEMRFGPYLQLRSKVRSNPLGPNRPVILCTWSKDASLDVGAGFSMTGGSICAAERISIGTNVAVGANTTITDTDFHPLDSSRRKSTPQAARTAPVVIEDDVFIGMNCLVLKGVTIGRGAVVGAGSVVTRDVVPETIVAGNPARVIASIDRDETVG
jgi:acetyltransferase-like isoleucine patch superfamily enzyme